MVKDSRPDIIGPAAELSIPFYALCASSEMHNLKHGRIVVKKIINCTSPSHIMYSDSRYTFGFIVVMEKWHFFGCYFCFKIQ